MAGIYTSDGQFAIFTRDAAPATRQIHDRIPVILDKLQIDAKRSPEVINQALTDLHFEQLPASDKNPNQLRLFDWQKSFSTPLWKSVQK